MSQSELLQVASKAARDAGAVLMDHFTSGVTSKPKGASIVSEADTASEVVILEQLRAAFPDHRIFSEEAGDNQHDSEFVWVIDPLDGTTNFVHHVARFCVSIGLLKNGTPHLGVVYEPVLDELFAAKHGEGATLNESSITVSDQSDMSRAVIQIGRGSFSEARQRFSEILPPLNANVRTLRAIGATALSVAYTACGRFDAHVGSHTYLYDGIAAAVIAAEAGAIVSDFTGKPWTPEIGGEADLLVSNPLLHQDFMKILERS